MGNITRFAVKVIKGDLKKALSKFKRKYQEFGIREELMERREYLKPSVKKRLIKQKAVRENERLLKIEREQKKY